MSQVVTEDTLYLTTAILPTIDLATDIGSVSLRFNNVYAQQLYGTVLGNISGSYVRTVVNASTYTILANDVIIAVTYSTTGICTVTLPLSSSVATGKFYHIVDEGRNCERYNITINTSGGSTIQGDTTLLMNTNGMCISVYKTSSGDWIIY